MFLQAHAVRMKRLILQNGTSVNINNGIDTVHCQDNSLTCFFKTVHWQDSSLT